MNDDAEQDLADLMYNCLPGDAHRTPHPRATLRSRIEVVRNHANNTDMKNRFAMP